MIRATLHGLVAALSVVLAVYGDFNAALVVTVVNFVACYALPWGKQ